MAQLLTANISMTMLCCRACGIFFAIPSDYEATDKTIMCPNGDALGVIPQEPEKPPQVLVTREELIAALHRAEQSEARASEAEAKLARKRKEVQS